MTEQIGSAARGGATRTAASARSRRHGPPRLLRPFRHPAYRRLALAMALTTITAGLWVVAVVWEVIALGGGPRQLSVVSTAMAVGVLVPALLAAPMVIWGTLLQRRVPPAPLGRVSSLDFFVSLAFMPVSMAVAGPVSEWVGLVDTFVLAGTAPLVLALVAVVWARMPADELAHPLRDPDPGLDAEPPPESGSDVVSP